MLAQTMKKMLENMTFDEMVEITSELNWISMKTKRVEHEGKFQGIEVTFEVMAFEVMVSTAALRIYLNVQGQSTVYTYAQDGTLETIME